MAAKNAFIDGAVASMADTTSQPSLNAFLAAMQGAEKDPKIDYLSLEPLDSYWTQVRNLYTIFESGLKCGSARVYEHQIPGGQYSNLVAQCKSMGPDIWAKWPQICDMYRDVNKLFGDIIKVTPSSKCVGDLALFLVTRNLTCDDILKRGETLEFPDSVVEFMKGLLGTPHHGFPKDIQQKILKGQKPLEGRPGDSLPAVDFEKEKVRLESKYHVSLSEESVISAILYPKVFDEYMGVLQEYGDKLPLIPTKIFLYGMSIGDQFIIKLPSANEEKYNILNVKLKRVGPLSEAALRTVIFETNGENVRELRDATIRDTSAKLGKTKSLLKQADRSDRSQIPSPIPGTVDKILCEKGQKVILGTQLLCVSAMKMNVNVIVPFSGIVQSINVKVGDKVDTGSLLIIVIPDPTNEKNTGLI